MKDRLEAEKHKKALEELEAETAAVKTTGQSKAEAMAHAEANRIEAEAALERAEMESKAQTMKAETELDLIIRVKKKTLILFLTNCVEWVFQGTKKKKTNFFVFF